MNNPFQFTGRILCEVIIQLIRSHLVDYNCWDQRLHCTVDCAENLWNKQISTWKYHLVEQDIRIEIPMFALELFLENHNHIERYASAQFSMNTISKWLLLIFVNNLKHDALRFVIYFAWSLPILSSRVGSAWIKTHWLLSLFTTSDEVQHSYNLNWGAIDPFTTAKQKGAIFFLTRCHILWVPLYEAFYLSHIIHTMDSKSWEDALFSGYTFINGKEAFLSYTYINGKDIITTTHLWRKKTFPVINNANV